MSYNSKIILCKGIKLDKDYVNVLSYSEQQMLSLCNDNSHKIAEASDYTFIDRNRKIRVAFTYSQCVQANYIVFQNPDYSNKWFFAFITNVEFKGNNNTEISFQIDSWSTWFDKWTKKPCYIIREHVNDDTIGANIIPENLDVGDVIEEEEEEDSSYTNEYGYWIAIASNWQPDDNSHITSNPIKEGKQSSGITTYNNQIFGNKIFLFEVTDLNNQGFIDAGLFLQRTNTDGYIGDVKDMFIVPDALIDRSKLSQHIAYATANNDYPFTFYTITYSKDIEIFNTSLTKKHSFSDFTPKNNKCFVWPYNYLLVSNNNGNNNIYKYEDFQTVGCIFENQLAMSIGVSGRLVPKNYKGMSYADDESLPLGKYPTCGWSADSYTNWLTQNSVNLITRFTKDTIETTKQFSKGDVVEGTLNIANSMAGFIGDFYSASLLPNIQGGGNTGNVVFGANKMCFTFRKMRVKTQFLRVIDDYFTRFGYKINRVLEPNIIGRTYWNYIEIGATECIGNGDVPTNFMEEINNACRRGTTIWHSHDNIGNYNLNNTIVS